MLEIVIMGNAHFEYFVYFSPCRVHSAQISSFNILYKWIKILSLLIFEKKKKKKKKKKEQNLKSIISMDFVVTVLKKSPNWIHPN